MSQCKIVILDGNKKLSFTSHYTYAMEIIESGKLTQRLQKEMQDWRDNTHFDPAPVDAGVIVFNLKAKIIEGENQGGFDPRNLKNFTKGWTWIDANGKVNYSNWQKLREEKDNFGLKYKEQQGR